MKGTETQFGASRFGATIFGAVICAALVLLVLAQYRSKDGRKRDSAPAVAGELQTNVSEMRDWPKTALDSRTGIGYVERPGTGEWVQDPATQEFRWELPLRLIHFGAIIAVKAAFAEHSERGMGKSTDLWKLVYGGPVAGRPEALERAAMVLCLPFDLRPLRGFEIGGYYVLSYRGRYDCGDYSAGIAIRQRDGEIVRWALPAKQSQ